MSIKVHDRNPDNNIQISVSSISFNSYGEDTVEFGAFEIRALKQLIPRLIDMDLFHTLTEKMEMNDESALEASIKELP